MYKEEHMISIIKPRGDIKPNWESANPVLRYREWGVEWEESVGIGDVNIKIGDGVTHWNNLDYAIVNNITKKIVKNFASIIDSDENPIENPELAPGDSVETLFGKIKNKFDYTLNFINALKNMVGDYQEKSFNTGSGTVTASDLKNAIDILEQYKLTTANILDVNDSTNPDAALSANQGRLINNKVNANTNAIDVLNSNLSYKLSTDILSFALSNNAAIGVTIGHFSGSSYSGNLPSSQLKYGTFEINKRNAGSISIKCFDIDNNIIWTNSYSNQNWKGWNFLYNNNNIHKIKHLGNTSLMDYLKNNVAAGNYSVISFLNLTDSPFKNMTYGYALVFKVWAISASWLIVAFNDSQQETVAVFPD